MTPIKPGLRQKTDRIDARKLAEYFAKDELTMIHVPTVEDEIDRDLVRSRHFVVELLGDTKRHIASICRRQGWDYRAETGKKALWTLSFVQWLKQKIRLCPLATLKAFLLHLMHLVENLRATVESFDSEVEVVCAKPQHVRHIKALSCYRGIDKTSALEIKTEIGDIARFDHPRRIVSYAGMDVVEYSSGGKERRYGISKNGNRHLRTALVEASQLALRPPTISAALKRRRDGADPTSVAIAERAMQRLHKKATKMLYAGKPRNKIKVACARELIGFIWETLRLAA
jgi:transposase